MRGDVISHNVCSRPCAVGILQTRSCAQRRLRQICLHSALRLNRERGLLRAAGGLLASNEEKLTAEHVCSAHNNNEEAEEEECPLSLQKCLSGPGMERQQRPAESGIFLDKGGEAFVCIRSLGYNNEVIGISIFLPRQPALFLTREPGTEDRDVLSLKHRAPKSIGEEEGACVLAFTPVFYTNISERIQNQGVDVF